MIYLEPFDSNEKPIPMKPS